MLTRSPWRKKCIQRETISIEHAQPWEDHFATPIIPQSVSHSLIIHRLRINRASFPFERERLNWRKSKDSNPAAAAANHAAASICCCCRCQSSWCCCYWPLMTDCQPCPWVQCWMREGKNGWNERPFEPTWFFALKGYRRLSSASRLCRRRLLHPEYFITVLNGKLWR